MRGLKLQKKIGLDRPIYGIRLSSDILFITDYPMLKIGHQVFSCIGNFFFYDKKIQSNKKNYTVSQGYSL